MNEIKSLKILHLSDLHVGMRTQEYLWPNLKDAFFRDLESLFRSSGAWDYVLFSGDIAQKGLADEFSEAVERLRDIWGHFKKLGFSPEFICVPGNHDIKRPDHKTPEVRVLRRWFEEQDVWDDFFTDPNNSYRTTSIAALEGYTKFLQDAAAAGIPFAPVKNGMFPGDQISRLSVGELSIGLLTFNSTWLQLTGDDYKGGLAVDLRQAHALNNDLPSWCRENDFNIVVTHHPPDWLHAESYSTWKSEISPAGRFDVHLFGHMHEPFTESRSVSGSATRNLMQAPSLFGMEFLADEETERIHGYSLLSFDRMGLDRSMKVWPRRFKRHVSGQDRFIPDTSFILEDDRFFVVKLPSLAVEATTPNLPRATPVLDAASEVQQERDVLKPLRHHFGKAPAHENVRLAEQRECTEALQTGRLVWLSSEWGLGSDEFLAVVVSKLSDTTKVYRLDAGEFADMDAFGKQIARQLGCNFAQFCDELSKGPALLILDNIPTGVELVAGAKPVHDGVEAFVRVLRDACPLLLIVMRTLQKPIGHDSPCVLLGSLDEADVKSYIQDHERGGAKLTNIDALSVLYRLTDGYPSRLDARLKELAIVSLEELTSDEESQVGSLSAQSDAPPVLRSAIQKLAKSPDKSTKRMYNLLQVLSLFPQGAEFSRVRRFNGVHPFHNADAINLMDLGLISISETPDMDGSDSSRTQKILVVPRPIRDYLRVITDEEAIDSLNMRAASLMFGPSWMEGSKEWPSQLDYSSSRCSHSDIANASALLIRLYRLHRDKPDSRECQAILMLASAFANGLGDGAHYTSQSNFCRDFLALMDSDELDDRRAHLIRQYAQASRMLGDKTKALELVDEIKDFSFGKHHKQELLFEQALMYEHSNRDLSLKYAAAIIKLDRGSIHAAQAEALIAGLELSGSARTTKLKQLEKMNRRRGRSSVADNIALTLAQETEDDSEAARILAGVLNTARQSGEFYNNARAVLQLIERKLNAGNALSDSEISQLIGCYQFLLNERVPALFNKCHRALWHAFRERGQWGNLMTLFRYSSLIWRLRGEEYREEEPLADLSKVLVGIPSPQISQSKVSHYYLARVAHQNASKALMNA